MRTILLAIVLIGMTGCLGQGEQKVRPPEDKRPPVSQRPIRAENVTPENGNRIAQQLLEALDREQERTH